MTKKAAVLIAGTTLVFATAYPVTTTPAGAEPLNAVCADPDPQHHQSCEVGYLAMYIPHGSTSDCNALYAREVDLHPGDELLKPDFVAGCEAAHRERIALGVTHGLDP